jgi:hypothetical protein
MNLTVLGLGARDWSRLVDDRNHWRTLVNKPSGSIKYWEIHE